MSHSPELISPPLPNQRCYEIDWLRSLAFLLLIFYHIGLFYVEGWGWHVKSQYQSRLLEPIMLIVNPWRMPLIFFISGFVLCLIEPKVTPLKLIKVRFIRIFIPLIFATYTTLIPQPYYEAVQNYGYTDSFWQFCLAYINPNTQLLPQMHHGPLGLFTWNHLWYLPYLLSYTLLYVLIKPILHRLIQAIKRHQPSPFSLLAIMIILMTVIEVMLEPIFPRTHALIDDWYNHARYFLMFVTGYLLAALPKIYKAMTQHLWLWVALIIPLYFCSIVIHQSDWLQINSILEKFLATLLLVTNTLCWMFTVIALCSIYLNKSNQILTYLNDAVLPWYILHQTVIIVLAMKLSKMQLGGILESLLTTVGTFLVCAALYELIRRYNLTRLLFGLRPI